MKLQPKLTMLLLTLLTGALSAFSQERTVTGSVRSSKDNQPLSGVSVMVEKTNRGTVTGNDGRFKLAVPNGNTALVFSYSGFATRVVTVTNESVIDISLDASARELSEVVVTAIGIEKQKKTVGFSVQQLGQKDLTEARDVNVANYLTGKIAGVQVTKSAGGTGGSGKVIIRGISSLTGENQPLYVVDGIPLDNARFNEAGVFGDSRGNNNGHDYGDGIGNLNPADIESLTVLKGPNATALYGSRGSNGVILITTKSGKAGKGIGVDVNSNVTMEQINLIPNIQNKYGPGYEDINVYGDIVTINGQNYETIPDWHGDSYGPPMDGKLFANPFVLDPSAPLSTFALVPQPKNNIKDFYDRGLVTNNSIALSGGSEKTTARLSVNNTTIKGITPNHKENMQSITLRVGTKVSDKLSFDGKVNYIHKDLKNAPALGTGNENIVREFATLGRFVPMSFLQEYYEKTGKRGSWPNVSVNPFFTINELGNNAVRDRLISFASVKYQFTNWLSIMGRSGIDMYSERRRQKWPIGSRGNDDGKISDETYLTRENNSDVLLTATKNNIKNFTASLSIGASVTKRNARLQGWDGKNFKVPGIYDISNTKNVTPYYSDVERELHSVYFSGQLGYKNFLFLDVTGRNDWSSTLGVDNYSFFYPSASASFVFTDAFGIDPSVLNFGKVRVSYAEAGNDAEPYSTVSGYFLNSTPINGQSYASQSNTIALFDLKNELKQSIEVGADLRFFGDRLGLDLTYYKSNTKNQIVPISISTASGYSTKVLNAGNIQNKGIEIVLRATPIFSANSLRWDVSFNYSNNQSKVLELAPGIETFPLYSSYPNSTEARIGQPFGNIIGYKYKRAPDGQKIVTDGGFYAREDEFSVLGNVVPKWIGGLNNTLSYKGFSLSALVDFVQGNKISSSTRYQMEAKGTGAFTEEGREHSKPLDGVTETIDVNGKATYAKNTQLVDGQTYWAQRAWGEIGEEFVLDGSFVMLREVILGYSLQPAFMKKTPFTGLRISLVGRNLWYIEEHMQGMGISPETNLNTQGAATGIEVLSMPTTRSFGVNLSFSF